MKITKYSYKDYIKGKTITNDENSITNPNNNKKTNYLQKCIKKIGITYL